MVRRQGLERLSFATAPALYAALWLSAGIVLAADNVDSPCHTHHGDFAAGSALRWWLRGKL